MNYFQAAGNNPYHVSVGALVINDKGEVGCHYFKKFSHPEMGTFEDMYLLMRETIHPNETIEDCLKRGLMEEFGATANLQSYIGSIISHYKKRDLDVQKTTLYFLCKLTSLDDAKRSLNDAEEKQTTVMWIKPDILLEKMIEQGKRLKREDADESVILERYMRI